MSQLGMLRTGMRGLPVGVDHLVSRENVTRYKVASRRRERRIRYPMEREMKQDGLGIDIGTKGKDFHDELFQRHHSPEGGYPRGNCANPPYIHGEFTDPVLGMNRHRITSENGPMS